MQNRPRTQEDLNKAIFDLAKAELEQLKAVQDEYNKQMPDDGIESLEEYREPLSIDLSREINIMLSCGGPSDGYKIKFDKDGDMVSGAYWYADWYTYAEQKLNDEELTLVESVYMYGDAKYFLESQSENY